MRLGAIGLSLGSAVIALGGIYLFLELRHGAPTPSAAAGAAPSPSRPPTRTESEPTTKARPQTPTPAVKPRDPDRAIEMQPPPDPAKTVDDKAPKVDVDTSEYLLEANKLYDRGDYDGARALAIKLLAEAPGNVRLLRVVVSSSCILGEGDVANQYAPQLPIPDRAQMAERCSKFQIALK